MNPSAPFILRPVATSLMMIAIMLVGIVGFNYLPLSALPEVDYPTIQVSTFYPGASPEVMTTSVTATLERNFGQMPGLKEMSSVSSAGSSIITLQFDLALKMDVAEQGVQAALNATSLPSGLTTPPTYAKVNPADAPILTLAVSSKTMPLDQLQVIADTRIASKISQQPGVGLVSISSGLRQAYRVNVNLQALAAYGLNIDDLRSTIGSANSNTAKGSFEGATRSYSINSNDQLTHVDEYKAIVIAYKNGAPVHLSDVADIVQGPENSRLLSWMDRTPAIILNVQRQPGANVIATVDKIKELLPLIKANLPGPVEVTELTDRTTTIRASVEDVEFELVLAVVLVVLVIYAFLRNLPATFIPGLSVPLSIVGTFAAMYLLGFSLNNLSLMALTISAGFVVDDAIVMIENISRYIEQGEKPLAAAMKGSGEIAFTIVSLTVSLIAVLIPLLFMQDVVGRLFFQFAITLTITILISAFVSLTMVPMLCAKLLRHREDHAPPTGFLGFLEHQYNKLHAGYDRLLQKVLNHQTLTLRVAILTLGVTVLLYVVIPKGFFPLQDSGLVQGITSAGPTVSFQAMSERQQALVDTLLKDSDVASLSSSIGVDGTNHTLNAGRLLINLKPKSERSGGIAETMARLAQEAKSVKGIDLFLQPVQDLTTDAVTSRAQYQFALQDASLSVLQQSVPGLLKALQAAPELQNVSTDFMDQGLTAFISVDRDTLARFGMSIGSINNALYDAFGQRIISTIFTESNQNRIILSANPSQGNAVDTLKQIYVSAGSAQVPLETVAKIEERKAPLQISHLSQFPSAMISFDTAPGYSLGAAMDAITRAQVAAKLPASITPIAEGSALAFQSALGSQLLLMLAAVIVVYIVLGVLYESFIHPITILSTLPSAGVGALLALIVTGHELNIVSIIGIILLIGIVNKNAVMMIDFALEAERKEGKNSQDAIYQAALLRFRPILMTTVAAIFGAVPLLMGGGMGSELRQPLGISIVGGLIICQILTLFTTPVIYIYFDKLGKRIRDRREARRNAQAVVS